MKPKWFYPTSPCSLLSRAQLQRYRGNPWKLPEDTCWAAVIRIVTPNFDHARRPEMRSQRIARLSLALMIRK